MEGTRVIGVDLGGTKILAGLLDREGRVERERQVPTPVSSTEDLLAGLESLVAGLVEEGGVGAIGIGIPGTIDQRRGRVVFAPNLPLDDYDFRDWLRDRFGLPVGMDNDANAAAIAEWRIGAGRGTRDLVMLTLGTGVGGGLILDGRPYRGSVGAAAELGHMVIEHDGPPCVGRCTGRGHLEALASGSAASRVAEEVLGQGKNAHDLVAEATAGNAAATAALADIGRKLGSGIGSLVNIFNPELVVIGGGFAAAGELVLAPAREVMLREALEPARDLVRIVPAQLGAEAGLVGAGFVGYEALDG